VFSSVHNYYEEIVFKRIPAIMQERGESFDVDLGEDIACLALNLLPPRYVRHNVDLVSSMSDLEHAEVENKVLKAINDAIELSKRRRNPH